MPFFLCLVIGFVIWLRFKLSKTDKASDKSSKEFWEKEQQANFVRKKDISDLEYIIVPLDELPFSQTRNEEIINVQNHIKSLSNKKILNLSGYSNTELKLAYGTANINALSDYDQNFTSLIKYLNKWGTLLYQDGLQSEAKIVLEYAVKIHSDISATYSLLAEIYAKEQKPNKIKELITRAESINELTRKSTLDTLHTIYETAFHAQE